MTLKSSPKGKKFDNRLSVAASIGSSNTTKRIGLFGGSFNPAHSGHLDLTNDAIKRLQLDVVWWLVSPLNPLKSRDEMADLDQRLARAKQVASNRSIVVTTIEQELGTNYSCETVESLQGMFPKASFVWLMGADNLATIDHWKDWTKLVESIPIAVFDRAPYSMAACQSKMAIRYKDQRRKRNYSALANDQAPSWAYVFMPRNPQSATALRESGSWLTE
jgi:nicotinate-nucleotide adenylyltransferase